jgi:hypothetical protein
MPTAMKTKINNIQTILIGSSSLPAIRASPLASVTGNEIRFSYIGAKDPYWLEVEYETDATTGDTGILFDVPTLMKTMLNSANSFKRDIQYEPTNLQNLVYPAEKTPTHLYIFPLKTRADDFMDILLQQPALEGNGRSIIIDLKDSIKTKINNIQTVQLEVGATVAKKYPAEISGNTVTILPLQTSDENFILVTNITPPSPELGRSIGIDMPVALKTKLNNIQTVQLETGATPAKKYPAEISGNTVTILPLQTSDENFILVTNITPPSAELGRSIGIDC